MKLKLPLSTKYLANCYLHGKVTYLCFICLQAMSIERKNFNTFCFVVQDFLHGFNFRIGNALNYLFALSFVP